MTVLMEGSLVSNTGKNEEIGGVFRDVAANVDFLAFVALPQDSTAGVRIAQPDSVAVCGFLGHF
jgi:hypothetical protein